MKTKGSPPSVGGVFMASIKPGSKVFEKIFQKVPKSKT